MMNEVVWAIQSCSVVVQWPSLYTKAVEIDPYISNTLTQLSPPPGEKLRNWTPNSLRQLTELALVLVFLLITEDVLREPDAGNGKVNQSDAV